MGLFRDFLPAPQICKSFFQPVLGFSLAKGISMPFCPPKCCFSRMRRHLLRGFRCFDKFGPHPDTAVANRIRSIAFRMSRKNSRGTAASAIWKTIDMALRRRNALKDDLVVWGFMLSFAGLMVLACVLVFKYVALVPSAFDASAYSWRNPMYRSGDDNQPSASQPRKIETGSLGSMMAAASFS